jgi:Leucine-rich repeat (LRR) protein
MSNNTSITFYHLPHEIIMNIYSFLIHENTKNIFKVLLIDKTSNGIINDLFVNYLNKVGITLYGKQILKKDELESNALLLFKKLIDQFYGKNYCKVLPKPADIVQQVNDHALVILWKRLDLSRLLKVPKKIRHYINKDFYKQKLEKIERLGLNHCGLIIIPQEIEKLRNLKILFIDSNFIKTIPSSLFKLINLQMLSLKQNQISDISDLSLLPPNLQYLYLDNNKISTIPNSIANSKIKELHLKNNPITDIPHHLRDCETKIIY